MAGNFTRSAWDQAWRQVAQAYVRDFIRAGDEAEAIDVWREAQAIGHARTRLAQAIAGPDEELQTALDPINPYQDLET